MRKDSTVVELANGRTLGYDSCCWRVAEGRLQLWQGDQIVADISADAWIAVEGIECGPGRQSLRKAVS